jgi:hypothetical protein
MECRGGGGNQGLRIHGLHPGARAYPHRDLVVLLLLLGDDRPALSHLLEDCFTYFDIDGRLQNKAQFLDGIKHPPEQIEIIGNDSLKTHVYRDTVIVSGTYHEKGTLNGKGYLHRGRFTDTWVRQGSSWMCVASQSTLMQR